MTPGLEAHGLKKRARSQASYSALRRSTHSPATTRASLAAKHAAPHSGPEVEELIDPQDSEGVGSAMRIVVNFLSGESHAISAQKGDCCSDLRLRAEAAWLQSEKKLQGSIATRLISGTRLLYDDETVEQACLRDGSEVTAVKRRPLRVLFSPNISDANDCSVLLLQHAEKEVLNEPGDIQVFAGHSALITAADISPDSRYVLSASYDRKLKLFDLDSGTCLQTMEMRASIIWAKFSSSGSFIIAAPCNKTVVLFGEADGQQGGPPGFFASPTVLAGHDSKVRDVNVSTDGKLAISASADRVIRVFSIDCAQLLYTWRPEKATKLFWAAFLPCSSMFFVSTSAPVIVSLGASGCHAVPARMEQPARAQPLKFVDVAPDGTTCIAVAARDRSVQVYNLATRKHVCTLEGTFGSQVSASYVRGDSRSILVTEEQQLYAAVFDASTGKCSYRMHMQKSVLEFMDASFVSFFA